MNRNSNQNQAKVLQRLYWLIAICFVAIVFVVDISTPRMMVISQVYFFPLFLVIFLIENRFAPFLFGVLCCTLIFADLFLSTGPVEFWLAFSNKLVASAFIFFGTAVTFFYKQSIIKSYQSEKKMSAALEGAPNGVLLVDASGLILFLNRQIESMFQYGADELNGKNVDLLVPQRYRSDHPRQREGYARNPTVRSMGAGRDLFGLRKDKSEFPIEIGLTPIETSEGFFIMASIVDITERKKYEDSLKKLNQGLIEKDLAREQAIKELERSNQELDDFAYIASHDLKEPLRGLFNNAKFLQEDYEDKFDAEGKQRLARLGFLCQRMESLVNDLLYFSRLGRQDLAIRETNLNEVIREIEMMMESVLQERGATIKLGQVLPNIICDKTRITEVFRNLITNAVKYNDKKKKIVEVGWKASMSNDLGVFKNVFYVKDNGIGIEKEFYEEVFRIFKRLNEESDDQKGTGVGLTFVRKIIERHGGMIWLESVPHEGTTFYFTIEKGETE